MNIRAWSADGKRTMNIPLGSPLIMPWDKQQRKRFTTRADNRLLKLRSEGMKWKDIASKLDRTYSTVFNRYLKLTG